MKQALLESLAGKTIGQLIESCQQRVSQISDSAKLDVEILLAHTLDKPRSYLLTWPERALTPEQLETFAILLLRRLDGEPIAYIIGQREFWSLPLQVSPATLIPRPDTEVLVEQVLANHSQTELSLLDLGTGTGAIALALASEQKSWHIEAVDFNEQAVALAQSNAKQLSLMQVNIYQSDWFNNVDSNKRFDVIVSNPPYIDQQDVHLSQGDVRFEPKSALVADDSGLADIRKIATQARAYFIEQGYLYIEHGNSQAKAVQKIFSELGYQDITTLVDYNLQDRVTSGCFKH